MSAVVFCRPGRRGGRRPGARPRRWPARGPRASGAGLLVDLDPGRPPRPSLIATVAARELEERLAAHLPEAGVASRGRIAT